MTKLLNLSAKIWFQRAKALAELKRYEDAIASVEKSLGILNPSDEEFNKARSLQTNLSEKAGNIHLREGMSLAFQGEHHQAIEKYNRAIQLNPNLASAYHSRGSSRYHLQDVQGAIQDWNQCLTLAPNYSIAYKSLAFAYHDLEDYQKALEYCNEAIRLKPDDSLYYSQRAQTRCSLKDYQRATDDCNQALQLMPENSHAYHVRGRIYQAVEDYQAAIEDYSRSLRIDRQQPSVLMDRGRVFIKTGNYQNAVEDYTQVINLEPKYAQAYKNLGVAWTALEDQKEELANYQEALASYHQAIKLFSEDGDSKASNELKIWVKEIEKYSKLRSLLMAKKWEEADDETARVIIAAGVLTIPGEDLRIIDNLWVTASDGRFGFSVQQSIWKATEKGAKIINDRFYGFGEYVEWWNGRWLLWSELTYSITAPVGHLPSGKFRNPGGAGGWGQWEAFFSHVEYGMLNSDN
ncbi:MAG: tetratricopeptide repeat protein [Microcoleus anatoxicus]|uniref:tetratricopeptide repeat protein n=1 Tax=Microcoleus anatoxicus TaxID=2705319 RepID=UPI003671A07C